MLKIAVVDDEIVFVESLINKITAVKNTRAMKNAVCENSRAIGMFRFYGASRTGRFSGRIAHNR